MAHYPAQTYEEALATATGLNLKVHFDHDAPFQTLRAELDAGETVYRHPVRLLKKLDELSEHLPPYLQFDNAMHNERRRLAELLKRKPTIFDEARNRFPEIGATEQYIAESPATKLRFSQRVPPDALLHEAWRQMEEVAFRIEDFTVQRCMALVHILHAREGG